VITRTLAAALCLCLAPALAAAASAGPQRPAKRYAIEQLMASDAFSGVSFSPDNSTLLVTSSRTGIPNLYAVPVAGGAPKPITASSADPISSLGYFPRDGRILYTSDHGGDELNHVFVRETDGAVRDLTPGARLKAKFSGWAQDHRSFFISTNERDPKVFDLYEYDAGDYSRRLLFENDKAYQISAISPNRRYVALSRIVDNASTYAYLYDTRAKTMRQLTPDGARIVARPQDFTTDGKGLLYTTDEGREFAYLARLDLETGALLTVYQTDWDVTGAGVSDDGRYLVLSVDEDARNTIRLLDARTFAPIPVPDLGPGAVQGFTLAHGAPLAAITKTDGDTPGDVVLANLETGRQTRLLASLSPQIDPRDLVRGKVVRFRSYDGVSVPGVLYVPHDVRAGQRAPAVIFVHGGPGDESEIGYKPLTQYLANHGYVVFEINNRGSRGSGKTFYHLDDRRHGDADLDDVVAAKAMLASQAHVDPERVAVMGQSYGGFMTLAALTFRPEAFAAGIDLYGVSNWVRLLPNTPPWWEDLRRLLSAEMGDWTDPVQLEHLRAISPVFHAEKIKRPLLVLQGANDPRVLPVESEDIVAKAKANGVPVEYVVFPDEGHGFRKTTNLITAYKTIAAFLDRHVRGAPAATEATR
jgi:dipeptidyl aminopeptidase/acylaminoacyl peptidase